MASSACRVWDFELPDAGHASQWTEADPFGALLGCNILDSTFRVSNVSKCATNHHADHTGEQPCLPTSTVDLYWAEMANHRINRVAWMYTWDFQSGVG